MNKKTHVLQIGQKNWKEYMALQDRENLEWSYFDMWTGTDEEALALIKRRKGRTFDAVICTDKINWAQIEKFSKVIEAYSLIINQDYEEEIPHDLALKKCPLFMNTEDKKEEVITTIAQNFFSGQMGSKLHVNTVTVNDDFRGEIEIYGQDYLQLSGDFSLFSQNALVTWQHNIGMYGRSKKIWLEFECQGNTEISITLLKILEGSSQVIERHVYTQEEIKRGIEVPYEKNIGYLSLSLTATGAGALKIGPLHFRDSRQHYGEYILGGRKIVDERNQELFYYFYPGDLKPPLNVYFSGYRSAEGFEGFFMMKKLGTPFLLITDPRLEGGSFYMGSTELERQLIEIIQRYLQELHFTSDQLILSGLSMGTYGALYYASELSPGYVIVGKPLVNIGDIAANEELVRPGGFPTSLDILRSLTGDLSEESVEILNQRFWASFEKSDFSNTRFIISYMKNDDYDKNAYHNIIMALSDKDSAVIGKGIPGRHNDNSQAINQWFINQYNRILVETYGRERKQDGF